MVSTYCTYPPTLPNIYIRVTNTISLKCKMYKYNTDKIKSWANISVKEDCSAAHNKPELLHCSCGQLF